MIDLHLHLLHGVDDGPVDLAQAVAMGQLAAADGCAALLATPHQRRDEWETADVRRLEERLAALEGGQQCVLVPSGLAAIATVSLALLKTGDEVLIPSNVYGPSRTLAEGELAGWGITHQLYDPMDVADLAERIGARTKLVWLEAPGSAFTPA